MFGQFPSARLSNFTNEFLCFCVSRFGAFDARNHTIAKDDNGEHKNKDSHDKRKKVG
jgi:hypothetical protein